MTTTTLNPADKAANATLSNGNLTITTNTTPYSAARSTTSKTTGKSYFEVTINAVGGTTAFGWGVADASATLTSIPGFDADGTGYSIFDSSFRWNNSSSPKSLGTLTNSSVVGVALDMTNKNAWIIGPSLVWDGTVGDNPDTNTGGLNGSGFYNGQLNTMLGGSVFAMVSVYNNSQGTVNFGATAFTYTVPSGFSAWDAAPVVATARSQVIFS